MLIRAGQTVISRALKNKGYGSPIEITVKRKNTPPDHNKAAP